MHWWNKGMMYVAMAGLMTGCASLRAVPPPQIRYDDRGREVERIEFNRGREIVRQTQYDYLDSVVRETVTAYHPGGGYTEEQTYHVWETPVSLCRIREYNAQGELLDERNVLRPTGMGVLEKAVVQPLGPPP